MEKSKTVLVLGAGASKAFGYSLGDGLRKKIIALRDMEDGHINMIGFDRKALEEFCNDFEWSGQRSIDAFLTHRDDYVEIGKRAIAYVLLKEEITSDLRSISESDPWPQYLVNRLLRKPFHDLDFSKLRIVSFNYDRALEHYLIEAIKATYDVPVGKAVEAVKKLGIAHVYGTVGSVFHGDASFYTYGSVLHAARIALAADNLTVIPEGRDNSKGFELARDWLLAADNVAFLGFSFDDLNMDRLNTSVTCARAVISPEGEIKTKDVISTGIDMTIAELHSAWIKTGGQPVTPAELQGGFMRNKNCTELFRETLILNR